MAEWRSNGDRVNRALVEALSAGLGAAAAQYAERVGRRLAWGYTSGRFVTGHVAGSVETTPVRATPDGLEVAVGSNVDYALFWELGHVNLFTRRFEREEIWRPYLVEMRSDLQRTVVRVATGVLNRLRGRAGTGTDALTGETREQRRQRVRNLVDR